MNNLFNLSRFILYIVSLYQPIKKIQLEEMIKEYDDSIPLYYIDPSLEILFQKSLIETIDGEVDEIFELTDEGHKFVNEGLLYRLRIVRSFSSLRTKLLSDARKQNKQFNMERERNRILVASDM